MRHHSIHCTLFALSAVMLSYAQPGFAQKVLVASDTDLLGMLDFSTFSTTGTATYTNIGTVGQTLVCMGYDSGNLYGLDSTGKLYLVNQATGALSNAIANLNVTVQSAAWDGNQTFYVLSHGTNGTDGTLQSINLSTLSTRSQGAFASNNTIVPDGFMAIDNTGAIYIGATDPTNTPPRSPNDAIYQITPNHDSTLGVYHIGGAAQGPSANTGYKTLTDGVNVNSTLYGFGLHVNDSNPHAGHSIFSVNTTTGAGTLASYYELNGPNDNITAAIVIESVPEASSFTLLSLMLGTAGGSLLLRRKRGATLDQRIVISGRSLFQDGLNEWRSHCSMKTPLPLPL